MATLLFRGKGDQFRNNSDAPLSMGYVAYYQASSTILQTTYADQAGTVANPNPLQLDGDGRLTAPVYFGSSADYKEIVTDRYGAIIAPWPSDNLPKASATATTATYSLKSMPWAVISATPSWVTTADAGKAYECNAASATLAIGVPRAASVGAGKGYTFKKISAANTVQIIAASPDLIEGAAYITLSGLNEVVEISSDGANWNVVSWTAPEFSPGDIKPTKGTATPYGWLYMNGAAVLIATYPNLAAAIYCGDGANASADECYKCTDPLNPTTSRNVAGTYIVVPDWRGEFIRGWDDSRGIDAGRTFFSAQADQIQDHAHPYSKPTAGASGGTGGTGTFVTIAAADTGVPDSGNHGTETRPRNKTVRWLIKT